MRFLFIFGLLFSVFLLPAQEVRFSFDKQKILLGEPLKMRIDVLNGNGDIGNLFSLDTLPHFEVLEQSKIDSNIVGGKLQLSQVLTITSWDSGRWALPTMLVNGHPSKPVNIDVSYTNPWDPSQPYHDIKGIIPVENPGQSTWWWYVIGAAVLVALFLLFFPEGKTDKAASELDSNAYKKAMLQLNKLQSANIASVNPKQYYTELINIFRTYLKGAKGIQSFSKTTDDLSIQLHSLKMPSNAYNQLVQALRLSDLVKFAQYKPEGKINEEALSTIKESITVIEHPNAV
jgi:hypothetical protein